MRCSNSITIRYLGRWVLGLAGLASAFAISARANVLPPPSTLAHCIVSSSFLDDPFGCSTLGPFDETFANLTLSPFVSLTAQATSAGTLELHGAGAVADVTYSFQVTGGNVGDFVPLLISTTLETLSTESDSTHSSGFAELNINTSAVGFKTLAAVCTDGSCGTNATSFIGTLSTSARSGAFGDFINLHVQAFASGTTRPFNEFASAFADPFIYIDPAFPNAGFYSIVVSPGVGNDVAPIPEPGALYLVGTALGALGLLGRRRL